MRILTPGNPFPWNNNEFRQLLEKMQKDHSGRQCLLYLRMSVESEKQCADSG
jgi:hypothetical protein